ncbi:synaptogyrin-2-like [Erpetoichthys calabaricus]|uniref:Synaptogyrin n=1 Tax=Erpetoichthys calabaricus TaxID=27687 RepID=A0A8C4XGQ3_ERPCA|nr:synaptogyrin-2-like [Erpetoichthys calabaricus]
MVTGAYGASKAGGSFDLTQFIIQPQTITRIVSWVFAIIVFSCITAEGYLNTSGQTERTCIFNGSDNACNYAIWIGVLAFLAGTAFFVGDIFFPQMSNVNQRKYFVIADLVFSGFWTFLWFVGFCFLTNQWVNMTGSPPIGADSARAAIAFSFFSIFSWGLLACFALRRYRMGVQDFMENYTDPAQQTTGPYSPYPAAASDGYQQPPFSSNTQSVSEGYQPPVF